MNTRHTPSNGVCCTLHVDGPSGTCCDPDDCGPCCPRCPTCPSAHTFRAAGALPRSTLGGPARH